ncbi:protein NONRESPONDING TO OXYLIPINS 2, mitochondrial-like isoform X2 [Impatiens glandulifera]|uniref:protein NONRESPONDING TO OXYLIPINS 2, mitochondrial-like isoform X2 n=1 Tax=Impatiens glandulifera TaxID=253017 RepID=UPI001FB0B262|nr:protein NONRESPONDING TO OXYLIPINS 2, mitochondrial-like isoform X2 [Impatiens glandulifera]
MASSCSRFFSRASISSVRSAIKSNIQTASSPLHSSASASSSRFSIPSRSNSNPLRRLSLSRSPSELGCVQSLLPLHSALATSRMISCLSSTSSSRALSQELGLSVPR